MKTRNLLVMGLLGLGLMTACSNEDEMNENEPAKGESYTQITLNVTSADITATKALSGNTGSEEYGEDSEYAISNLIIVLADKNNIAQQIIKPILNAVVKETNKTVRTTEPFTVNKGTYKVYVLANYNSSALSPIIKNSTDMTSIFDISTIASLYAANSFLMTNTTAPEEITFTGTGGKEVDGDGTEKSGGRTLQLIEVDIERVVSKVTCNNTDNQSFEVKNALDKKVATATLNGVSLINLNKKMYLVKGSDKAGDTEKPSGITGDWYYPEDPNYDIVLNKETDNTAWLNSNFEQQTATTFTVPSTAKFYCPENTMTALAQQNGQTTGIVYKVTYTPETSAYTELDKDGSDGYSQMFAAILKLDTHDTDITENMFKPASPADATFYAYNDYIFANQNAAFLYRAIATATAGADAAAINTTFTGYKTTAPTDVYKYENGVCYYPVWIKHNPDGTNMQQCKYGTVRNHWYELTVNNIKKLGYSQPTYAEPADPDDKEEVLIQVKATIKKWRIVKQQVDLE